MSIFMSRRSPATDKSLIGNRSPAQKSPRYRSKRVSSLPAGLSIARPRILHRFPRRRFLAQAQPTTTCRMSQAAEKFFPSGRKDEWSAVRGGASRTPGLSLDTVPHPAPCPTPFFVANETSSFAIAISEPIGICHGHFWPNDIQRPPPVRISPRLRWPLAHRGTAGWSSPLIRAEPDSADTPPTL